MKRVMTILAATSLAALASPHGALAADYDAECKKLASIGVPANDLPSDAEKPALAGCDSEALYYGIGRPADLATARKCALLEPAVDPKNPAPTGLRGPAVLAMIYANGKGVRRNLDLARRFVCEIDGAPAERDARLEHLSKLEGGSGKFDVCDDITSGFMGGECAHRDERIAAVKRDARLSAVVKKLPASEWASLRSGADAFFDARTGKEVDLSGTSRSQFVIEERGKLEDTLADDLQLLASHKKPPTPPRDFPTADAELTATYDALMKRTDFPRGTVTLDGIRDTERAWIAYRDAFVALATKARADVPGDTWRAMLTERRIAQLRRYAS